MSIIAVRLDIYGGVYVEIQCNWSAVWTDGHQAYIGGWITMTSVTREIESIRDPEKLKMAALNLLVITMQRQAIIRGLCKRLAKVETDGVMKTSHKG